MLSVIIATKDRLDLLKPCVTSLQKHLRPPYEIIVVDNGSDGSARWAAKNKCRVIEKTPLTFAQACNLGAKEARGGVLLLCNNDVVLTGPLNPLPLMGITGFRLLYPNGLVQHGGIGLDMVGNPYHLWHLAPAEHLEACKVSFPAGVTFALAIIPKDIWDQLGGLDEAYQNAYEDIDFCLRAREAGYPVCYQGTHSAIHLAEQTAGRNDHISESWQIFGAKWLATGRLYNTLGIWPFEITA